MDPERAFISKVVLTGQVDKALARGIEVSHLEDDKHIDIWEMVLGHYRKYKAPPSLDVVREKFPNYNFEVVSDTLDFVMDKFISHVKRRLVIDGLRDIASRVDDDDEDLDALFLEKGRQLSMAVPSLRVERYSDMQQRIERYKIDKKSGHRPGIKIGVREFDNLTMGIQPHEYATIMGWSGTGKSTFLQWAMFNAYLQDRVPMIISMEMEAEALFRKFDTMATQMRYHRLKALDLTDAEMEAWEKAAEKAKKASNDIIVLDDVGKCTVDRVFVEMSRYKPDVVGIDYITLMSTPGRNASIWESVTYLTRELKAIARTLKIPIYGVAQTNRDSAQMGAELHNVAYSVSIIQDSDMVFGMHATDEQRKNHQMTVRLMKNRDGQPTQAYLLWDLDQMLIREWVPSDQFPVREAEDA